MKCLACEAREASAVIRVVNNGAEQTVPLCPACFHAVTNISTSKVSAQMFSGLPSIQEWLHAVATEANAGFSASTHSSDKQTQHDGPPFLNQFGRNLTKLAENQAIDEVIGRDNEIARVIEILNRRNKNNPVLIGEPGVGKTAIAEGLAHRISAGQVPVKLQNKQVYSLDVASLVADTSMRGQFEERMKQLIAELHEHPEVILFIDEVHLIVGAGSAQGSMDAGNILKPVLARGELQLIGATTLSEYRQIEKDAALERRFQPVQVDEPSTTDAFTILRGIAPKYEAFHEVEYASEAIAACVTLSQRYIGDRYLPDKAIDLLDEAGSRANLRVVPGTYEALQTELQKVVKAKEEASRLEQYEQAATLRQEELHLRQQLSEIKSEVQKPFITVADIEQLVEEKTSIPVKKIEASEQARLRDFASRLGEHVIGQEEAVAKVSKAVRRNRAGLRQGQRPMATFLFVGPTGVGKTELAKQLAVELFGSKDAMIRLDMSEYMEKHTVSKLIGSPPGYVGFEEAGQLTEQVRRKPYSLILLDEIEKAHPDVQHMFLQIMEDGRLTDSQGRTVSFKDTLIIMTSNAGQSAGKKKSALGFGVKDEANSSARPHPAEQLEAVNAARMASLTDYFKPEFLNRFDAIVEFSALAENHIAHIVGLMLTELKKTLRHQSIDLSWTEAAVSKIGQLGYHPQFGARPLRRVIQDEVEDAIADVLLDAAGVSQLRVDVADTGSIIVQSPVGVTV